MEIYNYFENEANAERKNWILSTAMELLYEFGQPFDAGVGYVVYSSGIAIECKTKNNGKYYDLDTLKITFNNEEVFSSKDHIPGIWEEVMGAMYDEKDRIKSVHNKVRTNMQETESEFNAKMIKRQSIYTNYIVTYFNANLKAKEYLDTHLAAHGLSIGKRQESMPRSQSICSPDFYYSYIAENGYLVYEIRTIGDQGRGWQSSVYYPGAWEKNLDYVIRTYEKNKDEEAMRLARRNIESLKRG
jgi:hypothetical protein